MRVLKRHSDEDTSADGNGTTETTDTTEAMETTETTESRRPRLSERLSRARQTTTTEGEPTAEQTGGPAWRQRFRRNVTVPMTVPRRAVRRTVTVPARRVEPAVQESSRWSVAPILAVLAGAALAVIGTVALIRAGVNETWFRPRTEVLDANHTPLLGAVEIGVGALLILLGLAGSRILVAMAGIAGALVATAAAVEPEELGRELAIESWWAWVLAGAGVVLTLAALYEPRVRARRRDTVIDVR